MSLLGLLPSVGLALALASPTSFLVDGDARDALFLAAPGEDEGSLWVSRTTRAGKRELVLVGPGGAVRQVVRVPAAAVAVDACAGLGLVFSDARGVLDAEGKRLLEGNVLLGVPDPGALYAAPLCGTGAAEGELRVAVHGGILVRAKDGAVVTLPFSHRARAYSGKVHRGLRGSRPYALALSLYAPHLLDADVNGDGRLDLVAVHEGRVGVFLRGSDGKLTPNGAVVRELTGALGDDVDVRVMTADLDGDARADIIISLTEGAVPDRSTVQVLSGDALAKGGRPQTLWTRTGLSAPLGVVTRGRARALVVGEVDTSMVALGAALFTGEVPLKVQLHESAARGSSGKPLALKAQLDVRGGRMAGAMPVVSVDFDGDGREDLLDLGRPGRAALHPGTDAGFSPTAVAEHAVPAFTHVVPLPKLPGVVLVSNPEKGKTRVTLLSGERTRASSR